MKRREKKRVEKRDRRDKDGMSSNVLSGKHKGYILYF